MGFAGIVERLHPGEVKRYLRKIVSEETRNIILLAEIEQASPSEWATLVERFCRSAKDWQLPWDVGWWSPSWISALTHMGGWPPTLEIDEGDVEKFITTRIDRDPGAVYRLVVWCGLGHDEQKAPTKKLAASALAAIGSKRRPDLANHLTRATDTKVDELVLLFEVAVGSWNEGEACSFSPLVEVESIDVPFARDYVFDCHMRQGLQRLEEAGMPLRWQEPMPPGLDLRWSGAEAGTLWRYLAQQQKGTQDVAWESISIEPALRQRHRALVTPIWQGWKGIPPEVA